MNHRSAQKSISVTRCMKKSRKHSITFKCVVLNILKATLHTSVAECRFFFAAGYIRSLCQVLNFFNQRFLKSFTFCILSLEKSRDDFDSVVCEDKICVLYKASSLCRHTSSMFLWPCRKIRARFVFVWFLFLPRY